METRPDFSKMRNDVNVTIFWWRKNGNDVSLQFFEGARNGNDVTNTIFYLVINGNGTVKQLLSPPKVTGFNSYLICTCLRNQDKVQICLRSTVYRYIARTAQKLLTSQQWIKLF
jgi:hypothetical protein